MEVSIIIPVYNREQVVSRTLDSVLAQTHRPLQVVLVDNGSADGSLVKLNQFKIDHETEDFKVDVLQENFHSACAARNLGFEHATGEWVMFFDSDDVMKPDLVALYLKTIDSGDYDIVMTKRVMIGTDGSRHVCKVRRNDFIANHILHSTLATQAFAVRREFFAATDGWNINVPQWNDYELGLRLLLAKPRIGYANCRKSRVEVISSGEASITGTEYHSRHGKWEHVLDIMSDQVRCSQLENMRRYLLLLDYRRMVLAAQYQREGHPELAKPLCQRAFRSLNRRWILRKTMPRLFRRLVSGKRGASSLARVLIR